VQVLEKLDRNKPPVKDELERNPNHPNPQTQKKLAKRLEKNFSMPSISKFIYTGKKQGTNSLKLFAVNENLAVCLCTR
jgi:hypothetical protein